MVTESKVVSEEVPRVPWMRLLKLNRKDWPFVLIGCVASIVMGASLPIFAVIFGRFFEVMPRNAIFSLRNHLLQLFFQIATISDEDELYKQVNWLSIAFILLGIMAGVATFLQIFMLNIAGVRLTHRLRGAVFTATLKQEMGWYDKVENSVGALSARLSGDCATVRGATGSQIGSILQAISTIIIGIAVSLYFSWQLTIVSILLVPIVLAACFFEAR